MFIDQAKKKLASQQINISFSMISQLRKCEWKQFHRTVTDRDSIVENQAPFAPGSVTHELFEDWYNAGAQPLGWMEANAKAYFNKYCEEAKLLIWRKTIKASTLKKWGARNYKEMQLAKVVKSVKALEVLSRKLKFIEHDVQLEKWVTIPISGEPNFTAKGAMDVWDPKKRYIYDIKITENTSYGDPFQLKFYSFLIYSELGFLPEGVFFIYPLKRPYVTGFFKPTMDSIREVAQEIKDTMHKIKLADFAPTAESEWECRFCPAKTTCPRFGGTWIPLE